MSHVVDMKVQIKDLGALSVAAKSLGMELVRNQKTYQWYGRKMSDSSIPEGFTEADLGRCEHALRVTDGKRTGTYGDTYEIGVVRRRDGKPGYALLADFWQGGFGLEDKVGKNGEKLQQEYTTQTINRWAATEGLNVTRQEMEDGRVILRAS